MNLFDCIMTNNLCYKGTNRNMTVKGVLVHDTGAGNPNIKRYVQPLASDDNYAQLIAKLGKNTSNNDWNHTSRKAGVHAFIGKLADGSIATCHTLPYNFKPWGCGAGTKGSLNNCTIQFEICDDGYGSKEYLAKVYQETVEFIAYICKKYNLDPHGTYTYNGVKVPVITCHKDSHTLGLGSNHGDIHLWWDKYGYTMAQLRDDVSAYILKGSTPTATSATTATTASTTSSATTTTTVPTSTYKIGAYVVNASDGLNVRKTASASSAKVKTMAKGTYFSVSEVGNGWGKIADNSWVNLKYGTYQSATKYKVTASSLNVRKGAGTSYAKIGSLKNGAIAWVLSTSNGWAKVVSGFTVGYVSTKYITKA